MEIIKGDKSHARQIRNLIVEMASGFGVQTPISDSLVREYLKTPSSHVILCQEEKHIVGMASYSRRPCLFHGGNAYYIEEVIVKEAYRGQGFGSLLIKEIIKNAKEDRCLEISIAVGHENKKALKLYKKLGFEDSSILLDQHFL